MAALLPLDEQTVVAAGDGVGNGGRHAGAPERAAGGRAGGTVARFGRVSSIALSLD